MAKGNKHQQLFMIAAGALVVLAAAGLGVSEVMTARSEAAALAAA